MQDLQIVWLAPNGSPIKEGDPVIRFDHSKLDQELLEKRAALRQAQASLDQGEAQAHMRTEQDKVDLSSARYQSEKARLEASKQAIVSVSDGQKSVSINASPKRRSSCKGLTPIFTSNPTKPRTPHFAAYEIRPMRNLRSPKRLTLMELKSPLTGVVTYLNNVPKAG